MRYDLSPLYRSTVGFDRLFDLIDQAARVESLAGWPPYDIERTGEDRYRVSMAVAGFTPDELEVTQADTTLIVAGRKPEPEGESRHLHRGIPGRAFRQTFNLADHVKVTGASLENGLLVIDLVREVPEALKPRRIAIGTGSPALPERRAEPARLVAEAA
ncbi:Hsp20 family protein [Methylobacterium sp. JK268]